MFTESNPESLQGRAIRTPGVLLLQRTLHETVRLISCNVAPLMLVISDAGVSAEGGSNSGRGNSGRGRDLPIDARTVVPPDLSSTSLFMGIMFVHPFDFALFPYLADR
jgi:hypothetical protein